MDNLVLIRVAAVLDGGLRHAVLEDVRGEFPHRFRLIFLVADRRATVLLSLRPELPWVGRPPAGRRTGTRARSGEPFVTTCRHALGGAVLAAVEKPSSDRVVFLRFSGGRALVAELATHGANLVLLGLRGEVVATARHPRSAGERLAPGRLYRPPALPTRLLDPLGADAATIDATLAERGARGEMAEEAIRRGLFGIGREGARLIAEQARRTGRSPGQIVLERLERLREGLDDPVVLAGDEPLEIASRGDLGPGSVRLLPWEPAADGPGPGLRRGADAAATAGLYHEAVERALEISQRLGALRSILAREVRRLWEIGNRTEADLRNFEDPDRYRRWGEALLAGLGRARRTGEHVRVPDPYDEQRDLVIPAPPGEPLPAVADGYFRRHRRARRGLEAARSRRDRVRARRERLERLATRFEEARGQQAADDLEEAMRDEGIPVGLARRGPRRAGTAVPEVRLEGVRLLTGSEGDRILVGRTGIANHRLTFRIAAPEDFWLHVLGRPGAHVVLRNPSRRTRPSPAALEEAAALAAWYSDAKGENRVDVQWTQRKNVRRIRGAAPGTVTVKRFETVRVRPAPLESAEPA